MLADSFEEFMEVDDLEIIGSAVTAVLFRIIPNLRPVEMLFCLSFVSFGALTGAYGSNNVI